MGVRGRRIVSDVNEPTLLGNIDDIIAQARRDGFIIDHKVDIESIIRQNGILIRYEDLPVNKSGYLVKENGKWIIGINKDHHIHRQRYTMAHEFAHFCLHKSDNNFFEDEVFFRDENLTSIEFAANSFAANLLMPKEEINRAISGGLNSLKELADRFNISMLAVKKRVTDLGYHISNDEK